MRGWVKKTNTTNQNKREVNKTKSVFMKPAVYGGFETINKTHNITTMN